MSVNFNVQNMAANQIYTSENAQISKFSSNVQFNGKSKKDTFQKENKPKLSKKEIKHLARNNASGWSIFGGVLSTLYYGLRSNKTIAKKYKLDVEKDKDFIKEIRKDQVLWTIPGAVMQGPLGGILAWIYSKTQDESDMKIKSENPQSKPSITVQI